ncbi:LysE/ArgO family amino acid transporter [Raineyella sp. LH-20]|uniref:LysE/ArgO family amino acid transporter n=1 Tax=Raineyella sp. LH-20 TaxID=3081204 RepID=UPI00295574BA|nr:LysE/ArgO family amino acid transporter [Raineyella sp. LH-20]WOP19995.1 LysE/ArgO family amino acid transporter [Raineyella sp. LH-20]
MIGIGVWATGFVASFTLVAMIGAQNTMVMRQGIRRDHVGLVVLVCILSEIVLITSGTAGVGVLAAAHPLVMEVLAWVGAAYLLGYAVMSFRSAARPKAMVATGTGTTRTVLLAILAATYLNPQAYLDTMVLLGNLANRFGDPGRWIFTAGAVSASILWFVILGFGARALSGPLSRPTTWRWIDAGVGVMMLGLAGKLALAA